MNKFIAAGLQKQASLATVFKGLKQIDPSKLTKKLVKAFKTNKAGAWILKHPNWSSIFGISGITIPTTLIADAALDDGNDVDNIQ